MMVGRIFSFYLGQLSDREVLSINPGDASNIYDMYSKKINDFLSKDTHFDFPKTSVVAKNKLENLFKKMAIYGSYPAIVNSSTEKQKQQRLLGLYSSYVEKDIVGLLQLGKSEKFLKLVQYISLNIGQLFNSSSLQSELGLTYAEVSNYLSALEETYVIQRVTPYYSNKLNELKKTPLYYFADTGLRNWSIANFQPLDMRSDKGHLVENVVLKKLRNITDTIIEFKKIHFWRKKSGAEVDFVLERLGSKPTLIPIEVKYQNFNKPHITRSFHSFLDEYKPTVGMVVTKDFLGSMSVKGTNVLFLPGYLL